MDVRFARPFYRNGEIFCWLSNTGHWPDTGGSVPGGFSASATAVEQRGCGFHLSDCLKKEKWMRKFFDYLV